jgi:hypothetical protein
LGISDGNRSLTGCPLGPARSLREAMCQKKKGPALGGALEI